MTDGNNDQDDDDSDPTEVDAAWTRKIREKQTSHVRRVMQGEDTDNDSTSSASSASGRDAGRGEKVERRKRRKPKPLLKAKPNRYEVGVE